MSANQARVLSPTSSAMMRLSLSLEDLDGGNNQESTSTISHTRTGSTDCEDESAVKQRLYDALHRPENALCADCNALNPKWATVSHGGFICTQCAGVHRSLGVHVSFVLSCTLDKWTSVQVKMVETTGNDALNETFEFCVPDEYRKPHSESTRSDRERYIRAKYDDELFKPSPGRIQKQAVCSSSCSTSLSLSYNSPVKDGNAVKSNQTQHSNRKKSSVISLSGFVDGTRRSLTGLLSPSAATTSTAMGAPPSSTSPVGLSMSLSPAAGMVEYVGVLTIELLEGIGLVGMDINDKSDPYVVFRLGEQSITSKRVHNDVNPRWNETLMLSWDGQSPLIAEVFDHNTLANDRFMGSAIVDADALSPLLLGTPTSPPPPDHHQQQQELQRHDDELQPQHQHQHFSSSKDEIDALYQLFMPKIWARNFGEHMVAGAEGVTKGLYRGITGVWKDPIKGAKENGLEGFAKGVGTGMAGVVYRPIKGLGTMVKETARSVGVGRKRSVDGTGGVGTGDELVTAGCLHLKLRLQRF